METVCITVVKIYKCFAFKHQSKHLGGAEVGCSFECYQCLKAHLFFDDLREPEVDEDRLFEMLAKYCVLGLDVEMHYLEGVHEGHLLFEMVRVYRGESKHFPSLLSGILDAVIKDK